MPDVLGRKTYTELRGDVRRWLNASKQEIKDETGAVIVEGCTDPLYTDDDINMALNVSLTGHFIDLTANGEKIFSDEATIDVVMDETEYDLPFDLAFLNSCWWLDPANDFSVRPQNSSDPDTGRLFMYEGEEPVPGEGDAIENGAPRYRRQLNYIVLDRKPLQDKVGGILIRYVKWIAPLVGDQDVIESQYSRILQEIIVLDASKNLSAARGGTNQDVLSAELTKWEGRLNLAASCSTMPPFMQMVTPQIHRRRSPRFWR